MRLHLPVCLLTAVLGAVMTASAAVVEWDGGKGLWWDGCPMGENTYHNGDTVLFTSAPPTS